MNRLTTGRSLLRPAAFLTLIAGLSPLAMAELPRVLDRVPANAPLVMTLRNAEQVTERFTKFIESMAMPMLAADEGPVAQVKELLGSAGLDSKGSIAIAIVPGADGKVTLDSDAESEPTAVILLPVTDYAAFVKAIGGTKTDGIAAVKLDDTSAYAKDLGGGYAALTTVDGLLNTFDGKPGNAATHAKALGKNGDAISDASDMLFIANIPLLQEQIKEMAGEMKTQAEQMAAMAGEQGDQLKSSVQLASVVFDTFARDASVGVIGLGFGEKGVSIDIGAQFKEGSELAGMFSTSGNTAGLLGKVPNIPFYFAGAFDTSSASVRTMMKNLAKMQEAQIPAEQRAAVQAGMGAWMANADKVDGYAAVMGASPAAVMGGGLLVTPVTSTATSDAKGMLATTADTMQKSSGLKVGPMTTTNTYKSDAADINGVKVDTWSSVMEFDPNDPMAAQAQMMQGMIFGQGGLSGMNAAVEGGVVGIMSQNTPLMTNALDSAKSGKNAMGADPILKDVASNLPAGRVAEMYIGVKPLMEAIVGAAAMFGGAPEIKMPAQLSPVGMGMAANNGGVDLRIFIPSDVVKGVADVMQQFNAGMEDDMDDMDGDGGGNPAPRF